MTLRPILDFAHDCVAAALQPGDSAVDATAGNGHDTLFLAQQVGPTGHVVAFDVQQEALAATRSRLKAANLDATMTLIHRGHQHMGDEVPPDWTGDVGAVMFNLGYLPGHDKACVTRPETTLPALQAATRLLRPGGVITVVCYPGHEGGAEETHAVEAWAENLDQRLFDVLGYRFINQRNGPPRLLVLERKA